MGEFRTHSQLIEAALKRCNVRPEEKAVMLSSRIIDPADLAPYEEALRRTSDHVISVRYHPMEVTDAHHMNDMLLAAMQQADFVLHYRGGTFPTPFAQLTAHSRGIPEVAASSTRWLDICLNEANQFRLHPSDEIVAEAMEAARLMERTNEIHLTSDGGTDLVLRKDGRKGHRQLGLADKPGIWDNFGFAMVACAPLENSANGVVVVEPGDAMLQMGATVRDPITLRVEDGRIVKIEGGESATALSQWLERWQDPESYGVSHIGWGLHPNAVWTGSPRFTPVDGESYRGSILIAFGSNTTDMPARHSGIGGTRHCVSHLDVPLLSHSFAVDGVPVVKSGKIV
ncbi:hypothetical protein [Streptosporangium carneum]|uniref:Leucyl aminopeptidase n=1 Tax=Streptosporangium carneum TaxID=47481 RepID=A0A9W6I7N9_9ACTN|nr:hypothetical protein [Streptosporangium carneum]GLK13158.1 hypothetical protein GCM10017600_65690 [Streptosporangium carneum]